MKADGKIYNGSSIGENYGSKFKISQTIGCGLIFSKQELFFTLDGKYLGTAFKNVSINALYPTLSLQSTKEEVACNFGSDPFKFDLDSMIMVCIYYIYIYIYRKRKCQR